jgi:EAL domain-containing protein (putative c-di-GMP-specific phosphodiesterase class I)
LSGELRARARFDDERAADRGQMIRTLRTIIDRGGPRIVFQPIVDLATGATVGVEALSRFGTRTPDKWFADAATVGLGTELELAAIGAALSHLDQLDPSWILALNLSPNTIFAPGFEELIRDVDPKHLSFEITEHEPIADYESLSEATAALQARGARICVDDAGAGYASLRHILKLHPDVIKLDITLTRDVDSDPVKRALASSLERFAAEVGAAITAEGVETQAELDALRTLGINYGQGFFIAEPSEIGQLARTETGLARS